MGRRLTLLLAALLALLAAAPTDALTTPAPGAQNCARAFLSADATHTPEIAGESPCTRPGSNADPARIAAGCCVATKAGAGAGRSTRFVTTPRGTTFDIPKGWAGREADNGKGIVYQRPGATGNADMVRIMEPTAKYPKGFFRYYNEHGQPLGANGKPGPQSATHHSEDFQGPLAGWPGGG